MNRLIAALAALALAPAALAQDAAPDTAAIEGKVTSLEEQYLETKAAVAALSKLRITGYLQARYGWAEVNSFNNSATASTPTTPGNQGFFIRRGRLKAVYDADWSQYAVQIDIVPAGVSIKEGYATIKLPQGFALDVGLQLFPFGYEVFARSSSDLDTLERSRVTRAFLGGEYDIGAAVRGKVNMVSFKVGLFNGNGIDAGQQGRDNDPTKDVIGRAWVDLGMVTAGVNGWYGKTTPFGRADDRQFDRLRAGADVQVFLDLLPIGGTALKGEYIWGRTTIGTGQQGAGGNLPGATSNAPVPTGSGWYVVLTQNILQPVQIAARFEQYMPNHTANLEGATNTTVKVQRELQLAAHLYVGEGGKVSVAWYHPMNGEKGDAAPSDPKQDQFLAQVQAKF